MVTHSGTSARADALRALNTPRPITVFAEDGAPRAMLDKTGRHAIAHCHDTWIVQDEWWREEIDRQYYAVVLTNGELRTIYHDRMNDVWFEQAY